MKTVTAFGPLGVHVERYPTGRYGFVGHVPVSLNYGMADGSPLTETMGRNIAHCGPGIYLRTRKPELRIRTITYPSVDAALDAAEAIGLARDSIGLPPGQGDAGNV